MRHRLSSVLPVPTTVKRPQRPFHLKAYNPFRAGQWCNFVISLMRRHQMCRRSPVSQNTEPTASRRLRAGSLRRMFWTWLRTVVLLMHKRSLTSPVPHPSARRRNTPLLSTTTQQRLRSCVPRPDTALRIRRERCVRRNLDYSGRIHRTSRQGFRCSVSSIRCVSHRCPSPRGGCSATGPRCGLVAHRPSRLPTTIRPMTLCPGPEVFPSETLLL